MEAVGTRLGRSSNRFGPSAVFSGQVRKWKKKWVLVSSNNPANIFSQSNGINCNNGSHLLLYKWTPISQSSNNVDKDSVKVDDTVAAPEEPPRKKFRYFPIVELEELKKKDAELVDDEAKPINTDLSGATSTSGDNGFKGKPDINDVPMEETQALGEDQGARQDFNEGKLDLSLGLKAADDDCDQDPKEDQKLESLN